MSVYRSPAWHICEPVVQRQFARDLFCLLKPREPTVRELRPKTAKDPVT